MPVPPARGYGSAEFFQFPSLSVFPKTNSGSPTPLDPVTPFGSCLASLCLGGEGCFLRGALPSAKLQGVSLLVSPIDEKVIHVIRDIDERLEVLVDS